MSFAIHSFADQINIVADAGGLSVMTQAANAPATRDVWPPESLNAPGGWRTAIEIEQLLELGLAEESGSAVVIRYENFAKIEAEFPVNVISAWAKPSPFLLKIDRKSDIGRSDFVYRYEYRLAGRTVHLERCGYYVKRSASHEVFILDKQMYSLIEAMDNFNSLAPVQKDLQRSWLTFATVKGCAREVGAELDSTLRKNDVIIPSAIGLDMREDETGALSFLPNCPDFASEEFHQVFDRNPGVEKIYSLDRPGLGRVRIVLTNEQQEVLRRMKRVQRVTGAQRDLLRRNPSQAFDGVADQIELSVPESKEQSPRSAEFADDPVQREALPYGDRVIGVGEFQAAPVPKPFLGTDTMAGIWHNEGTGEGRDRVVSDQPASEHVVNGSGQECLDPGSTPSTPTSENDLPSPFADSGPHSGLSHIEGSEETPGPQASRPKKHLLIQTNEDLLTYGSQDSEESESQVRYERPSAFRSDLNLHPHQEQGVVWLRTCFESGGRRGVLMADDMGLGKTIQILTFLAWCIESGKFPNLSRAAPPFRPILLVVPLILLETKTWEREMERFFENEGAIFWPVLPLHGSTVGRFRRDQVYGAELELGQPVLDLKEVAKHRVVITNYETVRNYQHSFAYCPNGQSMWSVVVSDEAQEYKVPSSRISHSMKALKADFQIACTGTPVENRLLDLWNLFDNVQPGLLSSARDFVSKFESRVQSGNREEMLSELKQRLLFHQPNAYLLRRNKADVADLPPKRILKMACVMSAREIDMHEQLLRELMQGDSPTRFLSALHRFAQLSQHPALLSGDGEEESTAQLVGESSKLKVVIDLLHSIRGKREKVIVFARHRAMQSILSKVLSAEFNLNVKIINGETKSRAAAGASSVRTRTAILDEFKAKPGFNVLILSPFVAGIGLTITEANHVIHYGRWWNPAVESQATDRVYRIGQTKEVFVHLPILEDPTGRVPVTFDQRLDALMESKYRLAQDFLRPLAPEDEIGSELIRAMQI